MSTEEYLCWNESSVAHIFIRLITKTKFFIITEENHPIHNDNFLTLEEFNDDYKMLEGYIEWKRNYQPIQNYSYYNFSPDKMSAFLKLINYDSNNCNELIKLWKKEMMKEPNSTYLSKNPLFALSRL